MIRNIVVIILGLGVLIPVVSTKASENTLFAYDSLYLAGDYNYLIDSLSSDIPDKVLIKARALAEVGFPERAFKLLESSNIKNIQAAAIYYRYGEYAKALDIIKSLPADSGFQNVIYDYLNARCDASDSPSKLQSLSNLSKTEIDIFKSFANLHLAEYFYNTKQFDSSQKLFLEIDLLYLNIYDRLLYNYLLSRLNYHFGEYDVALGYLKETIKSKHLLGKTENITNFAADTLFPSLENENKLRLAVILRKNQLYDSALKLLNQLPPNDTIYSEIAWCCFEKKYYRDASSAFHKYQSSANPNLRAESFYGAALCEFRQNNRLDGVNMLLAYADSFPQHQSAAKALFTAGDFYMQSDTAKTIAIFKRLTENYADSKSYTRALYLLGILYHKKGQSKLANETLASYNSNEESADLFDYWQFKLNPADSSIRNDILKRKYRSYYNYLTQPNIDPDSAVAFDEFIESFLHSVEQFIDWKINRKPVDLSKLTVADSLYKYGLEFETGQYLISLHNQNQNPRLDLAILRQCRRFNLDWAFQEILRDFLTFLKHNNYSFTGDDWDRLSFPILYEKLIRFHAQYKSGTTSKFDPYLALAIVKRESLFQPLAISSAGAIGLMQLMPATAAQMANTDTVPQPWLLEPGYNIRLGGRYVNWLSVRLQKNEQVAAAYNAGLPAAKRWRRYDGDDAQSYIEAIGYDQTRNYARWVIGDYLWYKYFWPVQF